MSTTRSEPDGPSRGRARALGRTGVGVAALGVVAALVAGCGAGTPASSPRPTAPPATTPAAAPPPTGVVTAPPDPELGEVVVAPDVVVALGTALERRAAAVLTGDEQAFRRGLAPRDAEFADQQEQYRANLAQLPLQVYALTPDPATLVRDGAAYWVNVSVAMQLQGYDAQPVTTVDRYRFTPTAGGRRYRLASVDDAAWEQRNGVRPEPWDDRAVVVRQGAGVLAVLDAGSVAAADPLLRSVEQGIADVSARVPYPWPRTVVVEAFSDDAFLRSVPAPPGADPAALDAVAVPVRARPDTTEVVATRLVLHPRLLGRRGAGRDRLLRHELVHAAVGTADDHAPVWLSEGLAEWVSVQALDPTQRGVPRAAVRAAEAGVTDLPPDEGFTTSDDDLTEVHYAVSRFAVEHLAALGGAALPWTLLDRLEAAGAAGAEGAEGAEGAATDSPDEAGVDAVLLELAGLNGRTLARKAGKLLLTTVAPPVVPTPVVPTAVPPTAPPTPVLPTAPVVPPPA